jgi:DNA-3-methyladenine glycosylase II
LEVRVAKRVARSGETPAVEPRSAASPTRRRRGASPTIIVTEADVAAGVRALRRRCPIMRAVYRTSGDPPLRRRPAGFEGLARIVVGQQVSVASASAIWTRTLAAVDPFEPKTLLALEVRALAAAGLSQPKIRTLRALAGAAVGGLDFGSLAHASDDDVHAALTAIHGIGPWTADIFLMFCLGRADAWAAGDLALQLAAQRALGLAKRPSRREMLELAERWRPWRAVAARLLWAYYAATKEQRAGVPV